MAGGRPPKPPQLRILEGTHRDDRHGSKEAIGTEQVLTKAPAAPKGKGAAFVKWWKHYCAEMITVGVLTSRDLAALELLCDAHQDEVDARRVLAENRDYHYMLGMGGTFSRHPAFTTVERVRQAIVTLQINLGFSPAGRSKVPPAVTSKSKVQGLQRKAVR